MGSQRIYRSNSVAGIPGMAFDSSGDSITAINRDPQATQISTNVIDTATDNENYSLLFFDGSREIIVDSGGSTSETIISTLFRDAINADEVLNGTMVAELSGADLVLTARNEGVGFDVQEGQNAGKMTLTATAANGVAADVAFGRAVIGDGVAPDGERQAKLAAAAALTAQADSLLLVFDDAVGAKVGVKVYDPATGLTNTYSVEHLQTSNADDSVIALAALLNAVLPANTVLVTHPVGDTLLLTSETAGVEFQLEFGFGTARDSGAWTHTSNRGANTSINAAMLGISRVVHTKEKPSPTTPGQNLTQDAFYPANSNMNVNRVGRTWVQPETAPATLNEGVFVRLVADGALDVLGGFSSAPGTGLVRVDRASWHSFNANVAVIQLDRP